MQGRLYINVPRKSDAFVLMRWEHAAQQLATTAWTRCKSLVGVETISTRDLPRLHCWASKLVPQEFTRQNGEAFFTQQKRVFFCSPTNSTLSTNSNSHQGKPTTWEDVNKNTNHKYKTTKRRIQGCLGIAETSRFGSHESRNDGADLRVQWWYRGKSSGDFRPATHWVCPKTSGDSTN